MSRKNKRDYGRSAEEDLLRESNHGNEGHPEHKKCVPLYPAMLRSAAEGGTVWPKPRTELSPFGQTATKGTPGPRETRGRVEGKGLSVL